MALKKKHKAIIVAFFGIVTFILTANYLRKADNTTTSSMVVVLKAKVIKDDVFQFFYLESKEEIFKIKNSVRTDVKGSKDFQNIEFKLPATKGLLKLRLDIGENINQSNVIIEEVKIIKNDEVLVYDKDDFNRLFDPNTHINVVEKNVFEGKPYFIKSNPVFDPYFISNDTSDEMLAIRSHKKTDYPYAIAFFICLVGSIFLMYSIEKIALSKESVFIVLFFVILVSPSIQSRFQLVKPLDNIEKRKLAEEPKFTFDKKFTQAYEVYYDDNFGLRNHLINWGGTFRTKLFQSSNHPELVKFGKEKWLFYNKMSGRMYRSYSRSSLLTPNETERIVNQWQQNNDRYTTENRKYFLAFWPNKHSIYPEYLPRTMSIQIKDTIARVDQLLKYSKNNLGIKLTDVRPHLLENKGELPLYHKFDSHWNAYGAFLAYQEFFRQNPELGKPKTVDDFNIVWTDYSWGELIQMLGVRNKGFFVEKNPVFTLKKDKNQIEYLPIDGFPKLTVITKNEHSGNKLRVLVFRDSFTNKLIPFFSLHFHEIYYIWGRHEEYVEQLQPDIIIDGFVEREMGEKIPVK